MPTVLRVGAHRFYFWSNENSEPAHIHVASRGNEAKFWLRPIELAYSKGYDSRELRALREIIEAHQEALENAWDDYFESN